jgi:ATP synthase protein I
MTARALFQIKLLICAVLVSAAIGFMAWEMVKIAASIALLAVAPKWVSALSWPALLIGMVLTMKVYWVALAFKPAPRQVG